jgi:tetratricopeptide (TPR) repeat protein
MWKWTLSDERVARAARSFEPVLIRGDIEAGPTRKFRIRTFPTIIFFSRSDGEIDRKVGFRDADFMLEWIERVKKNEATIAALEETLKRDAEDVDAMLRLARNYLDAARFKEALNLARTAEEIAPERSSALALKGLRLLSEAKIDEAEAAIDAALAADPANKQALALKIEILLGKADAALLKGDTAGAIEPLAAVLQIDADNFDALIGAGRALSKSEDYPAALEKLERATVIAPNSPLPHESLGAVHEAAGDDAAAEAAYLKTVEIDPRYEPPYFRLIEMYERQGRRADMMEMYERALPLSPSGAHNEIAWLMATSKHADIRDPKTAIEHANIAIELEPHAWYIDTLAEAYYAAGRYDTAMAVIREAIAKKPGDLEYYIEQYDKFQAAKTAASPEADAPTM